MRERFNEYGIKNRVQLRINGILLDREFRSEGHAKEYLRREGFTKEEISRQVKFIRS